jgi:acylphosphatase
VFFRTTTLRQAEKCGLLGWVRNRRDGSVEAVAEGEEASLQAFVQWCHSGPPMARVDLVEQTWEDAVGRFSGFEARATE